MWLSVDRFAIDMAKDRPLQLYHYLDDFYLLAKVGSAVEALALPVGIDFSPQWQ